VTEAQHIVPVVWAQRPFVGQLTTITPDVITTKIIRRWPDEIGRPLAIG
jgi:hypothetical protein